MPIARELIVYAGTSNDIKFEERIGSCLSVSECLYDSNVLVENLHLDVSNYPSFIYTKTNWATMFKLT